MSYADLSRLGLAFRTVHHLNGDKADCRWWNLASLCQRCHLRIQRVVVMGRVYPQRVYVGGEPVDLGRESEAWVGGEVRLEHEREPDLGLPSRIGDDNAPALRERTPVQLAAEFPPLEHLDESGVGLVRDCEHPRERARVRDHGLRLGYPSRLEGAAEVPGRGVPACEDTSPRHHTRPLGGAAPAEGAGA